MGIICQDKEIKRKNANLSEENQRYKKALMIATDGNPKLIAQLEKYDLGIDLSVYKRNITQLIKNPENEIDAITFYDVIVTIQSIKDIIEGWKVKLSERIKNNYNSFINDKVLKIGVIGNSNKGKSFILSKLSKIELPSGTSIKTEGLSVKYPELEKYKNRKIALLDSAGLETPVIKENNKKYVINDEKEKVKNMMIMEI